MIRKRHINQPKVKLSAIIMALFLLLCHNNVIAPLVSTPQALAAYADRNCAAIALYYEARGEPSIGQRAVYDVIQNRAILYNTSVCQVVQAHKQFSFVHAGMGWQATPEMLERIDKVEAIHQVLPVNVVFFGRERKFGRLYKKIGNHVFSR